MSTNSITSPTYDPVSTATALAQKYTAGAQQSIDDRTKLDNTVNGGLSSLSSALGSFQSALSGLTSVGKTMLTQSADLSDTSYGSATANAQAAPGNYSFFVEQLATSSQVSYNNLTDSAATAGTLGIKMGGAPAFSVNMATADTDGNGTLTVREVAAAINKAAGNNSLVSAAVVTVGATQQLLLTAKNTGAASAITLDTSGMNAGAWNAALSNPANYNQVAAAQDAVVWLGAQATGTRIQQASNTFTNVAGVKITFSKAQANGASPLTLAVATDSSGTKQNVQAFIDAYNKLKTTLDKMVDAGDPASGQGGGVFVHDTGIRALRNSIVSLLRPAAGNSLAAYGITATRDGVLSLNADQLTKKLATDPAGLDTLIGNTSVGAPSGIAGSLDSFIKQWNSSVNGKIKQRQDEIAKDQKDLGNRQAALDVQYHSAYQRYLLQFTQLQTLQGQMSTNVTMFDALFGSSTSN
jgi:flagellar hook-associated protein 2